MIKDELDGASRIVLNRARRCSERSTFFKKISHRVKLLILRAGSHLIHGAPDSWFVYHIPVTMDGLINRGTSISFN